LRLYNILHSFSTSLHNDYQGQMSSGRHYRELVSSTNDYLSIFKALFRTNSTYGEKVLPSLNTSVCPVVEGHCEVPRGCLYFYSLFFTALDALPCPALFRIYLLLPRTGGGSYTGNSSSSSSLVGGSAPLDSVTVGGGVRFDGSLVAGMDETSVQLDG
jgi:hypothetical protein